MKNNQAESGSPILITGGCGFIGTSLVASILADDPTYHIRILDNFVTGTREDLAEVTDFRQVKESELGEVEAGVELIEGDIRDFDLVNKSARGVGCIIHLAANTGVGPSVADPRSDMESNVVGTFNMLEVARINGASRFVFASSGAPAGEVEPPIHEELAPHPVSPYGASKLAGEGYCSAYFRTFGIETVSLRFGNVYGPRSKRKSSVIAKFIRQALDGDDCVIFGDGGQTRDFIYIDDLVRAIRLGMSKDVGGETFQIATGRESTVGEVAKVISGVLGKFGHQMRISYDSVRQGDVRRNYSDTRKAARMLGWSAEMPLEQGVENTVRQFLQNTRGLK